MATVKKTRWDARSESPPKTTSPTKAKETDDTNEAVKSDRDSPESSCAICLSKLENKSFTDSCFHQFCFTCLLEWSKVKPECPLCKQSFKSIIHNIRSIEDYDQYHLRPSDPTRRSFNDARRFRYRSTLTAERRRFLQIRDMILHQVSNQSPERFSPWYRQRTAMTSDSRREIYQRELWVQPIEYQGVQRIREASPSFFQSNPACTHRLLPWLNRELVVLLENRESRVAFVMELVVSLIQRYPITSPEFAIHIRPYTLHRTDHFIHEFYHFARSPWDLYTYDQNAIYSDQPRTQHSPDSDIIVLSPVSDTRHTLETETRSNPSRFQVSRSTCSETSHQSGFALALTTHLPKETALQKVKNFLHSLNDNDPNYSKRSSKSCKSKTATATLSPQPGPSGVSRNLRVDSSDDDDCVIIGEGKSQQTPLVVDLISDSESSGSNKWRQRVVTPDSSAVSDSSSDEWLPRFRSKVVCPKSSSIAKYKWIASASGGTLQRSYTRSRSRSTESSKRHVKSSRHKKHKKHKSHHKKHSDSSKHKCKKHYKGHKSSSGRHHSE